VLRTRPVIGVFGSSRPTTPERKLAEEIGYQIAARGCIVLTGGDGSAGTAVRDRTITGAMRARQNGYNAAWVGVVRTPLPGATDPTKSSIILRPGYEHKRNYVEAHLCDAAIALPGRVGTPSEIAFCLVLRRPVVLARPVRSMPTPRYGCVPQRRDILRGREPTRCQPPLDGWPFDREQSYADSSHPDA
jgi:uncharacterized protein (TIGR00725 family)